MSKILIDEATVKLALEALEYLCKPIAEGWSAETQQLKRDQSITALREALAEQPAQQEPVAWGVDWGKAGDIPCVSIIKRLPDGGIEVMACEYAPYTYTTPQPPAQQCWKCGDMDSAFQAKCDVPACGMKEQP